MKIPSIGTSAFSGRQIFVVSVRLGLVIGFFALWQHAADSGWINRFILSSPSEIWEDIQDQVGTGTIWGAIRSTLQTLLIGYGLGVVVGTALGLLIGISSTARDFLTPFFAFFNALPRIVLVPIFVALLGFTDWPKILTVFSVIVIIIVFQVSNGVQQIGVNYIENARALGAGRVGIMRDVYLPGVSVWLLAASRVAMAYAFHAALVAEYFGSAEGLGFQMHNALTSLDSTGVYSALVVASIIAFIMDRMLVGVQRRTTVWLG